MAYDKADIERAEIVREIVAEEHRRQREERQARQKEERKAQRKARSKVNPGDPWILKFDKWLDQFRPY